MSTQQDRARQLVDEHGTTFAEECGIAVQKNTPSVLWQVLLASHLISARISSQLSVRAAGVLCKEFPTAERLADADAEAVYEALDRGDYLRKRRTTTMLQDTASLCQERYHGDLRRLRDEADDVAQMSKRLQEFSGIGPVGAEVFLREVQVAWPEVAPFAGERALEQAKTLRLPTDADKLAGLLEDPADVPRLMVALVRHGLAG